MSTKTARTRHGISTDTVIHAHVRAYEALNRARDACGELQSHLLEFGPMKLRLAHEEEDAFEEIRLRLAAAAMCVMQLRRSASAREDATK